jgi:serine/threonine-protein kinase RsbW
MVATVRAVAAHLAGRADFDIDTIADLRLAVDEACSSLVQIAAPSATLNCAFILSAETMHVVVATTADSAATVDTTGFGWQLLRTLTDSAQLDVTDQPGQVAIRFVTHSLGARS